MQDKTYIYIGKVVDRIGLLVKDSEIALEFFSLLHEIYSDPYGAREKSKEAREKIRKIFGTYVYDTVNGVDGRFILTLTQNGKELRAWTDLPFNYTSNHVNSFLQRPLARGPLFEMRGDSAEVRAFLKKILDIVRLTKVDLPNGVELYLKIGAEDPYRPEL